MKQTFFAGLAVCMGFPLAASCASSTKPPPCVCADPPMSPGPPPPPPSTSLVLCPPAPPEVTVSPPPPRRRSISEVYERYTGLPLSPLDKSIMDTCPAQVWSKNVPKRRCTNDDQCGDGFCDRGRCGATWTCDIDYGRPCKVNGNCENRSCVDGRCRSCMSERECDWTRGRYDENGVTCRVDPLIPGSHACIGEGSSRGVTIVPMDPKSLKP